MLSPQLKQDTKTAHQSLEKIIVHQLRQIRDQSDYVRFLNLFYGFYSPMEKMLDHWVSDKLIPDYSGSRKSADILNDIAQMSPGDKTQSICTNLPDIHTTASAIGAFYVLEGSNLGGKIIAAMLEKNAGIPKSGVRFFLGYGDQTMPRWAVFLNALDQYAATYDVGDQIIDGANRSFKAFENWALTFYAFPSAMPLK